MPRGVVLAAAPTLGAPRPQHALADTIIYEVHVRGFTAAHPDVPPGVARHLRRSRTPGAAGTPGSARRHRGGAAAGPPQRARGIPGGARPDELLGRSITELHGKTLGIIGLGHIGQEVARRGAAFDMDIVYTDPLDTLTEVADRLRAGRSSFALLRTAITSSCSHRSPTRRGT